MISKNYWCNFPLTNLVSLSAALVCAKKVILKKKEFFMPVILVSPLILIIALSVGIIVATRLFNKRSAFSKDENVNETDGTLISVNIRRINFLAYINEYDYTYTVNGNLYSGNDTEGFFFEQKRNPLPKENVKVEYIKAHPEQSRLKFINHKNERLRFILAVTLSVLLIVFLIRF